MWRVAAASLSASRAAWRRASRDWSAARSPFALIVCRRSHGYSSRPCWPVAGMPIEGPIRSQRLGAAVRERRAGPAPAACCTNTPSATQMPQDSQDDQPPVRESGFAIFKRFFFSASGIIPVRTYLQSCMYFNKVPFQRQPKNWAESWVKQHGTISWVKQHGIIKEFKPYAARASPEQMAGFACVRESALI